MLRTKREPRTLSSIFTRTSMTRKLHRLPRNIEVRARACTFTDSNRGDSLQSALHEGARELTDSVPVTSR